MEEKKTGGLFREKSLEAVESPESLNDYLRVTSPGVWLILAAVICLRNRRTGQTTLWMPATMPAPAIYGN